jgi:cell division protein ZapE
MYAIGLLGVQGARDAFRRHRLVCVDEWELDDPGNLKMAIAFLRGALADGVRVAATSNTVPDELGRGRFAQKSFTAEIEELAAAFQVVRLEGEDYRHRHFRADPGREHFTDARGLDRVAAASTGRVVRTGFQPLMEALGRVHPVHYATLAEGMDLLLVEALAPIASLADGLRWVHLVDKLYDGAVEMAATATLTLGELFPAGFVTGPFGKKFSRCLSRMEEMLGEPAADAA